MEDDGVTRPCDLKCRRRLARHRGLVTAGWLIATAISLGVAARTSIGPVVQLSKNHGVHAGDLVGFASGYLNALALTAKILRKRPLLTTFDSRGPVLRRAGRGRKGD
jgi:hypothetical protein